MIKLGATLRAQAEARKIEGERKAEYASKLAEAQRQEERAQVRAIFTKAKAEAEDAANSGVVPKGVVVKGYGMPFLFDVPSRDRAGLVKNQTTPIDVRHPYHDVFAPFAEWATENDVMFKVTYEHDGFGMESWHRVTVVPC